ncbi:hypothetical protein F5B20DRAFT_524664 [Whalleya microplaca]|nr:hypothetical protein F5B20DRAFT_524664 [Whalleya microplaca]
MQLFSQRPARNGAVWNNWNSTFPLNVYLQSIQDLIMKKEDLIQICHHIWPYLTKEEFLHHNYTSVFEYFTENGRTAPIRRNSLDSIGISEVISIIGQLTTVDNALASRANAITCARLKLPDSMSESTVLGCLDMALRMILTLNIRPISHLRDLSTSPMPPTIIYWRPDLSLHDAIEAHFIENTQVTRSMTTGRIDPSISLPYLCTYRGFRIFWTSNLAEHLSISWNSKIITVYEHKIFLWNHLRDTKRTVIPRPILEEAIDTLNLLFPLNDPLTKTYLTQNGKTFSGLGYCTRPRDRSLELGKFNFWRDRIADLVGIMNEQPRGLRQLALERNGRNMMPFVTFWVATAVAILTILNLPFAIVSMRYAMLQYDLALAQACSDPGAQNTLPQFCG